MTLDDLALAFEEAKAAEKAANQKRIDIESEILKLVHNQVKEEGRTTFITNGKAASSKQRCSLPMSKTSTRSKTQQRLTELTSALYVLSQSLKWKYQTR